MIKITAVIVSEIICFAKSSREAVYAASQDGRLTKMADFAQSDFAPPLQIAKNCIYAVRDQGGKFGCGVILRIDSLNHVQNLYSFTGKDDDGAEPDSLVLGEDGNLYGTTKYNGANGAETIFELDLGAPAQ